MPPSYVKNKAINQMEIEDRASSRDQQDLSPHTLPGHLVLPDWDTGIKMIRYFSCPLFLLKCELKKVVLSRELVTSDRSVVVVMTYHVQPQC